MCYKEGLVIGIWSWRVMTKYLFSQFLHAKHGFCCLCVLVRDRPFYCFFLPFFYSNILWNKISGKKLLGKIGF